MQQFKIGDWVDYAGEFYRVHEEYNGKGNISKEVVNSLVRHGKNVQLWQPKEDEYCCFHNGKDQFTVAKFQNHSDNTDTHFKLVSCYGKWTEIFKYCEPFFGELPSFLKEYPCNQLT